MSAKLGASTVSLYLGSQSVSAYLGGAEVYAPSVPGTPTISSANSDGLTYTAVYFSPPASNGGSPITGYAIYIDDVLSTPDSLAPNGNFLLAAWDEFVGGSAEVAAVNAVGEGAKSDPVSIVVD